MENKKDSQMDSEKETKCPECNGSGERWIIETDYAEVCMRCAGRGVIPEPASNAEGREIDSEIILRILKTIHRGNVLDIEKEILFDWTPEQIKLLAIEFWHWHDPEAIDDEDADLNVAPEYFYSFVVEKLEQKKVSIDVSEKSFAEYLIGSGIPKERVNSTSLSFHKYNLETVIGFAKSVSRPSHTETLKEAVEALQEAHTDIDWLVENGDFSQPLLETLGNLAMNSHNQIESAISKLKAIIK